MTMSFFGKRKNLGPPAPPRRTDNSSGWPQDEFDDEDADMYEVPPCERPAVKVPPRQVEENVYLERTSNPAVPQRQPAPAPRPDKGPTPQQRAEDFFYDRNIRKPPEIDRNEKPGRKKMMPPPPARFAPAPVPAPSTEEDVYLDPNEEQDDLYLEPTAACPPAPRAQMRMPPSPKTPLVPSPIPGVKPPVPRAKSSLVLEPKTAPAVEPRRAPFPSTIPPPPTALKPPLPVSKPSPPNPPMADIKPAGFSGGMRATKQTGNEDKQWFAGDCNRKTAEDLLLRVNKDGAFLIRHSSAQSARQPYTLAVLYQQKVYNVPIRFLEETRGYALGKEGKKNEEIFSSLDEMISHHKKNQLLLIDSKSQAKHTAYLTHPARP